MCLFEQAAGRRPDRKGEKAQGYTRVRPEQLGRSGPLPGRGYRQKLRLVRSFCFREVRDRHSLRWDFHMRIRPDMPANDTGGIRHRSGRLIGLIKKGKETWNANLFFWILTEH